MITSVSSCSQISNNPPACDSEESKEMIMNILMKAQEERASHFYRGETIISKKICVYNGNIQTLKPFNYYEVLTSDDDDNQHPASFESRISEVPRIYIPSESESNCYRYYNSRTKEYEKIIEDITLLIPAIEKNFLLRDARDRQRRSGLARLYGMDPAEFDEQILPRIKEVLPFIKKDYKTHLRSKNNWILLDDVVTTLEPFVLISQSENYTGDYSCKVKFSIKRSSHKLDQPRVKEFSALNFILYKTHSDQAEKISQGGFEQFKEL